MFFPETINANSMVVETNMSCLKSILQSLLVFLESLVQRTPTKSAHQILSTLSVNYLIIEWEAFYLLFDHVLFVVRKELFSSSTTTIKSQERLEELLLTPSMTEQFLRTLRFLLQFTPSLSEHIHGHVLNLLSIMFFITQHDSTLAIQIIQRLLNTFQLYQQQSIGTEIIECEIMQSQASNAFLYLCKNFTVKMMDFYSELFPFLCQLYKDEFQLNKNFSSLTIDESSCPTLKLLDAAQTLLYQKFLQSSVVDQSDLESFYELVKPIYQTLLTSLAADCLSTFLQHLDLLSDGGTPLDIIRSRRRNLLLALHCLCLLIRYSKQQQQQINFALRTKITFSLRPILFDYIVKVTQFCNQLYDRQINPFYDRLKVNLTYSETEKQLYLGTYESNNMAKASIISTTTSSSLPVSFVRFQSNAMVITDDQRLRDYLHRLFDICYQIHGMYFAHDQDLYHLKLSDENYFLTSYLQQILFANLHTLPSIRLRIVLRHFCRSFVEHYCSSTMNNKDKAVNELFLSFLDIFLPYIQQRLTTMWTNLSTNSIDYQQDECSNEVIEECVCVLLTRDFVDLIRYFIYKTVSPNLGQNNSNSTGQNKKKSKMINGRHQSESMCEETNGIGADADPIDEWDESSNTLNIGNKLLNGTLEKMDYSDLFLYLIKMSRENSTVALRLFTYVIRALFECMTFPDAYCVNRFLPIILPLTKFSTDIIEKLVHSSSESIDIKFLFQCLLKALERHNENEGLNTNMISLIGHIYELWHNQYHVQLDLALHQMIPQLNLDLLNSYKARLTVHPFDQQKRSQPITERERRDAIKNLLNPLLLSPLLTTKKETLILKNSSEQSTVLTTI